MTKKNIDFVSNDFLGFAQSPILNQEVRRRCCDPSIHPQGVWVGSGGSRLMIGTSSFMKNLEKKIATYHGAFEAFIVNSGYVANLGLCYHVSQDDDVLLWDENVHMSVKYSLCVTKGVHQPFHHNDLDHLESLLQYYRKTSKGRIFVFICSVYSFTGTFAPLEEILALTSKYGALLVVDEAHAVGIFGKKGRGLCYSLGYENFYAVLVTFGKALGGMGAAILSSLEIKEKLMYDSPPLRYTTCLAPTVLVAIEVAYDSLASDGEKARQKLSVLREYFSKRYPDHAMGCVQPIYIHTAQFASAIDALQRYNIQVGVVSFTDKKSFIRVNLHSFNGIEEIDLLLDVLNPFLEKSCCRIHVDHELYSRGELC